MGTEVLRPQDFLVHRIRGAPAVFPRRRSFYSGNPSTATTTITNANISSTSNFNTRSCRRQAVKQPELKRRLQHQSESSSSSSSSSSSVGFRKPTTAATEPGNPGRNLVIGQVTILKRGQSLDLKRKDDDEKSMKRTGSGDLVVCGTERLGPDPELVPKQIRMTDLKTLIPGAGSVRCDDVYAGSAFSLSPSPRALPLPRFSTKKEALGGVVVDDSATKDLRRLLRLD